MLLWKPRAVWRANVAVAVLALGALLFGTHGCNRQQPPVP